MTYNELEEIYDKVSDVINRNPSYHVDYICHDKYYENGSIFFNVLCISDQGEGSEWEEYWSIDCDGRIHGCEEIYENFEDFLKNV